MDIFIAVLSDCCDPNAVVRYKAAFWEVGLLCSVTPVTHPLQAAGTAVDIIDKLKTKPGVVFINIAPRRDNDKVAGHANGRDFLYFYVGKTLVVTSDEPEIFGLFQKINLPFKGQVRKIELPDDYSQFRSADHVPKAIKHIINETYQGKEHNPRIANIGNMIWHIDNFGNCKTTMLNFASKGLPYYSYLTDLPDGRIAQIKGSSGYESLRWVEYVIKGGNFAKKHNMEVGSVLK